MTSRRMRTSKPSVMTSPDAPLQQGGPAVAPTPTPTAREDEAEHTAAPMKRELSVSYKDVRHSYAAEAKSLL